MHAIAISRRGFTLIELSIVLVIIGLIVGGVLVGRDLIKAAETRSVISDIENFKTAANTFNAKYDCLPGDCPNATHFFGTTDSQGNAIHNGNGNGILDDQYTGSNGDGPVALNEPMWVWQELSLAGLIPGYYNGMPGHANNSNTPFFFQTGPDPAYYSPNGANAPASKVSNGVYGVLSASNAITQAAYGNVNWYPGIYGNFIILAQVNSSVPPYEGVLTPAAAFSIDSKIDDGVPSTGSVVTGTSLAPADGGGTNPNCAVVPDLYALSPAYNLSYASPACSLMFLNAF